VSPPVKSDAPRTRRAERARATADRIVQAARGLFLDRGYVPTTIEAIADAADVAVETVYARFRNKRTLLLAVVEHAVSEAGAVPLHQRPELGEIAAEPDPGMRAQRAASLSRGMLQRISPVYALLKEAARTDESLCDHVAEQVELRTTFQRKLVDALRGGGALRAGLTPTAAAETYSALANPELYLLLTQLHGWTPAKYERWLAATVAHLLLVEQAEPPSA
jgi:AcrR family transcriptional regulator